MAKKSFGWVVVLMLSLAAYAAPVIAHSWHDVNFANRPLYAYPLPSGRDDLIGSLTTYRIQPGDTLLDVGRWFGLSAKEISDANGHMDWEPDPTNPLLNVLAGTQRVKGVQAEVRARLTSRWDLLASYAYLDGRLASSNYYPGAIGAQLANVPRNTLNFWSTGRLPWNWDAGFGGNYVFSRTASSTAPFDPVTKLVKEVPGYWVFNAMARHRLTEHVDLQVNVNNIANRYYYDELHPAHIVLGPGRSALIGLKFKF